MPTETDSPFEQTTALADVDLPTSENDEVTNSPSDDEGEFDAERWYRILEEQKVNVWYTAPTAIRRLMRLEANPLQTHDLSNLRFIASVGEPLNPEAVKYLNRLSDLLFVLSRHENDRGQGDVLWVPGQNR